MQSWKSAILDTFLESREEGDTNPVLRRLPGLLSPEHDMAVGTLVDEGTLVRHGDGSITVADWSKAEAGARSENEAGRGAASTDALLRT